MRDSQQESGPLYLPLACENPAAPPGYGVRYWAESPDSGPGGFGFRTGLTLLFPKK